MKSREIVEQILRAGRDLDVEAFVALMAPDGYIEWPYRPPGAPARLQGRAEIRRHLTTAAGGFIRFEEYRNVVVHETTDPEVVHVCTEENCLLRQDGIATSQDTYDVGRCLLLNVRRVLSFTGTRRELHSL